MSSVVLDVVLGKHENTHESAAKVDFKLTKKVTNIELVDIVKIPLPSR